MELAKIDTPRNDGDRNFNRHVDDVHERLHSALRIVEQIRNVPLPDASQCQITEKDVRAILKLRRNRDRFFDEGLFADPAWDILLELYAASLGQQRVSVTSLCVGAAVPATTALRWIGLIEKRGMIVRSADPFDNRRVFLSLSDKGFDAMSRYFRTVPMGVPLI